MQYDLYLSWQWASGIITRKLVVKKREGKVPPPPPPLKHCRRSLASAHFACRPKCIAFILGTNAMCASFGFAFPAFYPFLPCVAVRKQLAII